jgi:uncharacterized tellurite resistance protein B-like protein
MFNPIKLFFEHHLALSSEESLSEQKLQIATAALFLEMMTMDDKVGSKEHDLIFSLIEQNFSLTAEQTKALLELAEQQRKQATDYFQFTSLINKAYNLEQKIQLITSLWKIAFANGILDANEEYLVRKIADLLYVPHIDFIMKKNQVKAASKKQKP